ncbi:MAG: tyrosine--tRNA ligase [Chloroflexi bacterium RBG_13_68_17]|nr:MAG: tyrosine--tRNA ligase [Chloroflexi bacterium RBG_13_68_17]
MTIDEQVALLMQGAEYGDEAVKQAMADELRRRLAESKASGQPLRVYCGYDPRTPDLHLGHTITMRKLRQFQDLGHEVILVIGTGTSLVGDPSDKDELRATMTTEEAVANGRTYAEQAYVILDRERTVVRYNHEWLLELSLADMIRMASAFTLQQIVQRENFRLRWDRSEPIYLHETFYALMQGYDAVALQADVQVGGSEQLFNILTAGRKLQELYGQRPQVGILMGILPGTDGVVRMSKSLGNHIAIHAAPEDMYGKVMSLPDTALPVFFRLVTRYTPEQVARVERDLAGGARNPRDVKMELAREIVTIFRGQERAAEAEHAFVRVFQERQTPEDVLEFRFQEGSTLASVLSSSGLASSKSEARRLVEQGGVTLDGVVLTDPNALLQVTGDGLLQVGKRRFRRVIAEPPQSAGVPS